MIDKWEVQELKNKLVTIEKQVNEIYSRFYDLELKIEKSKNHIVYWIAGALFLSDFMSVYNIHFGIF